MLKKAFLLVPVAWSAAAVAKPAPAHKAEADAPSDNMFNVALTLPGGAAAEVRVVEPLTLGLYGQAGSGGFGPGFGGGGGGGGRRGNSSTATTTDRTKVSSTAYGVDAHWAPFGSALATGFFVNPSIGEMSAKFSSSSTGYSTTGKGLSYGLLAGWGWFWQPGFNIRVGGGIHDNVLSVGNTSYKEADGSDGTLKTKQDVGVGASLEAAFGYAF